MPVASVQRQPKRRPWRLRTRLAAGLIALFLAVFALIAYSHFEYLSDRKDARLEDMQRVSQTVAASFDGLTHDLESLSLSTAITLGDSGLEISPAVSGEARERVNAYLQHLYENHGLLRAMFVTDTEGRVIFDNDGNSYGRDLSDRRYIKALQAGAPEYWSGSFPGSDTGTLLVTHSRAIVGTDGEVTGFLVIALPSNALAARLPEGVASDGHISILDDRGTLVLRVPDDGPVAVGTSFSDWPRLSEARTPSGLTLTDEPLPMAPADRYGALIPMSNVDWVVAYSLPEDQIEGATTGLFLRDVLGLGAIILLAFIAMWMFANRMVRPLSRLTEVAGAISRGEPTNGAVLAQSADAEVQLLADTMEHMRVSIEEREAQLRARTTTIEAIERFGERLASELDPERAVRAIIEAGIELVDADAAQFFRHQPSEEELVTGPRQSLALAADHPIVIDVLGGSTVHTAAASTADTNGNGVGPGNSLLGIPVRTRAGEVEGALILLKAAPHAFTAYHLRLAEGLARWACIVLDNATLYARSQTLVAELAESNEAKNDFLGIVSHELRTPITTIYGGTLLLRLRRESLPEQAMNDMIVSISEEAERLHHLVQDLLTIARTELVVEPRPTAISEVVQTSISDFSTMHRREINVHIDPDLPPALADSTFLRQVVTNLVSNADKYTPVDQPIEIAASEENDEICVRVLDNGPGISDSDLPQVFDSFYRSKDAAERASGSGLGLTVCKRLIESLGGRIWAQNRPEGGLEVGFTLRPARDPEPAPSTTELRIIRRMGETATSAPNAHSPGASDMA